MIRQIGTQTRAVRRTGRRGQHEQQRRRAARECEAPTPRACVYESSVHELSVVSGRRLQCSAPLNQLRRFVVARIRVIIGNR